MYSCFARPSSTLASSRSAASARRLLLRRLQHATLRLVQLPLPLGRGLGKGQAGLALGQLAEGIRDVDAVDRRQHRARRHRVAELRVHLHHAARRPGGHRHRAVGVRRDSAGDGELPLRDTRLDCRDRDAQLLLLLRRKAHDRRPPPHVLRSHGARSGLAAFLSAERDGPARSQIPPATAGQDDHRQQRAPRAAIRVTAPTPRPSAAPPGRRCRRRRRPGTRCASRSGPAAPGAHRSD